MKLVIAALASIAFAAPAFAALPSAPLREAAVKTKQSIELVKGQNRNNGFGTQSKSNPYGRSS
ncbi:MULTISPECIES: hypothetical protein [unclassified Rhizobium]|jgi:hypothetical protein|uniref:hypothetical protein n=1 Tax=unclassified Rhizobium TaxID=2613769 RepID=UPI000648CE8C|nr:MULTISPECIES: hypothetical protein [unclassified Rhizobium]MBN8952349.1 hypothetical protein [Rhizobium tropici]OJY79716.1 MAG: hypothetical protein BGP09_07190 [Rhizobium sp. 60-20]RKD66952.1 hypothetical protein BJ928_106484 [Rhizobium sp. WW_1]